MSLQTLKLCAYVDCGKYSGLCHGPWVPLRVSITQRGLTSRCARLKIVMGPTIAYLNCDIDYR